MILMCDLMCALVSRVVVLWFFFKQKTAYEMRIGDWSSDVCSSDLFIAGYIWSNVLLASYKPAIDNKTFLISANAGPSQLAGTQCSPYFFSASWQNDQNPMGLGMLLNQKGVKKLYIVAPNYAAGQDMATRNGRASCREKVCPA